MAYAAASVLVDAARFLRDITEGRPVVRRKLNQPVPSFGVPGGTYDLVQSSLISGRNAWHLFHAIQYFDANRHGLETYARRHHLSEVFQIASELRPRLEITLEALRKPSYAQGRTNGCAWQVV